MLFQSSAWYFHNTVMHFHFTCSGEKKKRKKKNGKNAKQMHTAPSFLFVLDLMKGNQSFDTENNRGLIMMLKCYFFP